MLKLKLQYTGHLMQRTDLFEKTLMLGKIEDGRRRGRQRDGWMASLTQWTWVWASSRNGWRTGKPGVLQSMESKRVRYDWANELNWTELRPSEKSPSFSSFLTFPLTLCLVGFISDTTLISFAVLVALDLYLTVSSGIHSLRFCFVLSL